MMDEQPEDTQETDDESEAEALGGKRLRAARRDNDISIRDIAKELHLDETKVRALEENSFEVLGAPVFAKGHLKKYAELVAVPVDEILSDYYKLNRSTGAPPVVGPKRVRQRDFSLGPWVAALLAAIVVAAAAYWWFTVQPTQSVSADVEPASLAPFADDSGGDAQSSEELPGEIADVEPEPAIDSEPAAAPGAAETAAETGPQITDPIIQDAGTSLLPQVQVELSFSGDCWTEASDASGRRLFYDLGAAGRVVTIGGDAPLRIVLGDANNVSIRVEGRDFPIPASARSGRLARLTINRP